MTPLEPSVHFQVVTALIVGLFMVCCVILLYAIRDRSWSPPRRTTRTIWCPKHLRQATIDVRERVSTGMVIKDVKRCSLIDEGVRCHWECLNAG